MDNLSNKLVLKQESRWKYLSEYKVLLITECRIPKNSEMICAGIVSKWPASKEGIHNRFRDESVDLGNNEWILGYLSLV